MSKPQSPEKDPVHLVILRVLVYTSAALLFTAPLAGMAGMIGVSVAALLGVLLARWLTVSSVRWPILLALVACCIACGFLAESVLGGAASLLGNGIVMRLIEGLGFGMVALGVVLGLRLLSTRVHFLSLLEAALVVCVVIVLFAGHRGGQIQQPMSLADWSYSHGFNPVHVYLAIGFVTLMALTLLLVGTRRKGKTVVALPLLWIVAFAGFLLAFPWIQPPSPPDPDRDQKHDSQHADANPPPPKPKPQPQPKPEPQPKPQPGPDPQPQPGPLPKPTPKPVPDDNDDDGPPSEDKPQPDPGPRPPWPAKPRPTAVVILHAEYEPIEGAYYFRRNAYSQFEKGRFVLAERQDVDTDLPRQFPSQYVELPGINEAIELGHVPMTIALIAEHKEPFTLVDPISMENCDNPNPQAFLKAYKATSRTLIAVKRNGMEARVPYEALIRSRAGDPSWTPEVRRHYLAHPSNPKLIALAKKISDSVGENRRNAPLQLVGSVLGQPGNLANPGLAAKAGELANRPISPEYLQSPYLRAQAVRLYVEENITYALDIDHRQDADIASAVLFGDRRGHCVHVAYCMVGLMRSMGIPARVGSGYCYAADKRAGGSALMLSDTDRHAWCEIYLDGVGWVVVDAALKKSIDPPPPPIDPNLQKLYAEMGRGNNPDGSDKSHAEMNWWFLLQWPMGALLGLLLSLYAVKVWRWMLPYFAPVGYLSRVCYRAVLDRLAEVGLVRQSGETREEFARRLESLTPALQIVTVAHLRQAVGGVRTFDRRQWVQFMSQINRARAKQFSAFRRWVGLLNPVSWLWSR
jgi:protein-glutamine gamma-glutamyltransferase